MIDFLAKYYTSINHILYHAILLIGIVIGVYRIKKLTKGSQFFLLLLVITLFNELLAYHFARTYHDNRAVYNIFNILQFGIISLAFGSEGIKRPVLFIFLLYISFSIINSIFYQPLLNSSATNSLLVQHLLTMVIYFIWLVIYFKKVEFEPLKRYPLFWIGCGWLLFSITSIVAFGFSNLKTTNVWDNVSLWAKIISNYLLYLSFIPAFLSPQKSLKDIAGSK